MLTETLNEATDAIRHTLRDIASEGLDRTSEFVTTNASEAVESARTRVEGIADQSAEWLADDDHRRDARNWIAIAMAGTVAFLATIWLVRWIRARRRLRRDQRAKAEVRKLVESQSKKAAKKVSDRSA